MAAPDARSIRASAARPSVVRQVLNIGLPGRSPHGRYSFSMGLNDLTSRNASWRRLVRNRILGISQRRMLSPCRQTRFEQPASSVRTSTCVATGNRICRHCVSLGVRRHHSCSLCRICQEISDFEECRRVALPGRPPAPRLRRDSLRPTLLSACLAVARTGEGWLGRLDSNQGSRDQNPMPYRLATPQYMMSPVPARFPGWQCTTQRTARLKTRKYVAAQVRRARCGHGYC